MAQSGSILIIGFGNTLRGDDGLGPYVVQQLGRREIPGVHTRIEHQLTPELSQELARADAAIFVDACTDQADGASIRAVTARPGAEGFTHVAVVEDLLGLTRTLYQRVPRAWIASIAGADFAFRDGLSPQAQANAERALQQIEALLWNVVAELRREDVLERI